MNGPIVDADRVLVPWQYELLHELTRGPLTGGELASIYPIARWKWLPRTVGVKLAAIERHTGFVAKSDSGIWSLTEAGRRWIEARH